ncbi:hypothetical protein KEM55_007347, partial [Ascosphaera atra]
MADSQSPAAAAGGQQTPSQSRPASSSATAAPQAQSTTTPTASNPANQAQQAQVQGNTTNTENSAGAGVGDNLQRQSVTAATSTPNATTNGKSETAENRDNEIKSSPGDQEGDDTKMGGTEDNDASTSNAAGGAAGTSASGPANGRQALEEAEAAAEFLPFPPTKKATNLREFLGKMDDYAPIIPDAVTAHYLSVAGLPPPGTGPNQTPPYLARLLALATQKFIADIATDAYQYSRIRASNSSSASNPMGGLNMSAAAAGGPGGAAGAGEGGAGGAGGGAGAGRK